MALERTPKQMAHDLDAAERLVGLVKAASDQGWLHPECTGGDCRLAQLRTGLIEYLGAVPSFARGVEESNRG